MGSHSLVGLPCQFIMKSSWGNIGAINMKAVKNTQMEGIIIDFA